MLGLEDVRVQLKGVGVKGCKGSQDLYSILKDDRVKGCQRVKVKGL